MNGVDEKIEEVKKKVLETIQNEYGGYLPINDSIIILSDLVPMILRATLNKQSLP